MSRSESRETFGFRTNPLFVHVGIQATVLDSEQLGTDGVELGARGRSRSIILHVSHQQELSALAELR